MEKSALVLPASWGTSFAVGSNEHIRRDAARRGDFNILHHNTDAARRNKLDDIVAPGTMTIDKIGAAIGTRLQGVMVHEIYLKFTKPLYAGSAPTILYEVVRQRRISAEMKVTVINGDDLVGTGSCGLLLPRW